MEIWTTQERYGVPAGARYPLMLLRSDRWDDFGYKTMFHVELWRSATDLIEIGATKLMHRGLQTSPNLIELPENLAGLGSDFCSLGQALSYYETLSEHLSEPDLTDFLVRMRDVAIDESIRQDFESEAAFQTSLLRDGGARRALEDAPELLRGEALDQALAFTFTTSVGGDNFTASFRFGDVEHIPSRINAVIGYNGVGKTRFLANLAHVAWRDLPSRQEVRDEYGGLEPAGIPFGRVVAISYSAFDTFDVPRSDSDVLSYVYCGLRDVDADSDTDRLKSPTEITDELRSALHRLKTENRWQSLNSALAPLFREPSFQLSSTTLDFRADSDQWIPVFERLSTGHKISLNIVVQLVAQLENKSLVLVDEPESHLHPPLLAALMKGVTEALEETNSFAIVATHSPVVLQEVSTRHVQVLRRFGTQTLVERPRLETFGENVGILTRTVFNLDNAESDYEGVLQHLGVTLGVDGLESVFPDGLSSQALALVMEAEIDAERDQGA